MTRGSRPPTYRARLLGSGAERRTKLEVADPGDAKPAASPSTPTAVGIGLLFCGMTTGGRGGGGICEGLTDPMGLLGSYCCWPGAPAKVGGGGRDIVDVGSM